MRELRAFERHHGVSEDLFAGSSSYLPAIGQVELSFPTVARIVVHISICPDYGFGIFYDIGLSAEAGSRQDWPGVWIFLASRLN